MFQKVLNRVSTPDSRAVRWLLILGIATIVVVVLFVVVSSLLLTGIAMGFDNGLDYMMWGEFTG